MSSEQTIQQITMNIDWREIAVFVHQAPRVRDTHNIFKSFRERLERFQNVCSGASNGTEFGGWDETSPPDFIRTRMDMMIKDFDRQLQAVGFHVDNFDNGRYRPAAAQAAYLGTAIESFREARRTLASAKEDAQFIKSATSWSDNFTKFLPEMTNFLSHGVISMLYDRAAANPSPAH